MNIKTLYCVPQSAKFVPNFFQNFLNTKVIRNNIKLSGLSLGGTVSIRYNNMYMTFSKTRSINPLIGKSILSIKLNEQTFLIFNKDYINHYSTPALLLFVDDYGNEYIYDPIIGCLYHGHFLNKKHADIQSVEQRTHIENLIQSDDPITQFIYNFIGYNGNVQIPDPLLNNIIMAIEDKYTKSFFVLDIIIELVSTTISSSIYNGYSEIKRYCKTYDD